MTYEMEYCCPECIADYLPYDNVKCPICGYNEETKFDLLNEFADLLDYNMEKTGYYDLPKLQVNSLKDLIFLTISSVFAGYQAFVDTDEFDFERIANLIINTAIPEEDYKNKYIKELAIKVYEYKEIIDDTIINSQEKLNRRIKFNYVNRDITIIGKQEINLRGINKIQGSLGLSDCNVDSLEEIKEITGDLWTRYAVLNKSKLQSLGSLKKIGGEADLRYSDIIDLEDLEYVGERLSLRDTKIEKLGKLKFIGGNLLLPMRLKKIIDLSSIEIKGIVRHFNDEKREEIIDTEKDLGLEVYNGTIPYWEFEYIYSYKDLEDATEDQKEFYLIFKHNFLNDVYLDLEENTNYVFILYYDLLSDYPDHRNIQKLKDQIQELEFHYSAFNKNTLGDIRDIYIEDSQYEEAWKIDYENFSLAIDEILLHEHRLQRKLLDGYVMYRCVAADFLSDFGRENIEELIPFINKNLEDYEKAKGCNFFDIFLNNGGGESFRLPAAFNLKHLGLYEFEQEYYRDHLYPDNFSSYKKLDDEGVGHDSRELTYVAERAILEAFEEILSLGEWDYREANGITQIGEGWISESELFYKIEKNFPDYYVIHHGSPIWLGRQHLDIYFPDLNIGVEYQGRQHFEAVDFFGGEEALADSKVRDERKRIACMNNNCELIYVLEGYDFTEVKERIEKAVAKSLKNNTNF